MGGGVSVRGESEIEVALPLKWAKTSGHEMTHRDHHHPADVLREVLRRYKVKIMDDTLTEEEAVLILCAFWHMNKGTSRDSVHRSFGILNGEHTVFSRLRCLYWALSSDSERAFLPFTKKAHFSWSLAELDEKVERWWADGGGVDNLLQIQESMDQVTIPIRNSSRMCKDHLMVNNTHMGVPMGVPMGTPMGVPLSLPLGPMGTPITCGPPRNNCTQRICRLLWLVAFVAALCLLYIWNVDIGVGDALGRVLEDTFRSSL